MMISEEVLTVLSKAKCSGPNLVLDSQLDRNLYLKTNKVLEAAGGKWNRKTKSHVFDGAAEDRIEQMILTGSIEVPKDEFNFFETPPEVVSRLIELADLRHGMRVLEPSAGRGAIVKALIEKGARVDCCELMEANFKELVEFAVQKKAFVISNADDKSHHFPLGTVPDENCPGRIVKLCNGDFMDDPPFNLNFYDRIVMNPPFMKQADIKHVLRAALRFMKIDGLLVSVMAAGVKFRENQRAEDFRELVAERGGRIEDLPAGSFKSSGTTVNAVIVVLPGELYERT